jgi:hypothetical protein
VTVRFLAVVASDTLTPPAASPRASGLIDQLGFWLAGRPVSSVQVAVLHQIVMPRARRWVAKFAGSGGGGRFDAGGDAGEDAVFAEVDLPSARPGVLTPAMTG